MQVLYLHATLEEPPAPAALHRQFEAALGPLGRLVMLSISNNNLAELPAAVAAKTSLRVLHVEVRRAGRVWRAPFAVGSKTFRARFSHTVLLWPCCKCCKHAPQQAPSAVCLPCPAGQPPAAPARPLPPKPRGAVP